MLKTLRLFRDLYTLRARGCYFILFFLTVAHLLKNPFSCKIKQEKMKIIIKFVIKIFKLLHSLVEIEPE